MLTFSTSTFKLFSNFDSKLVLNQRLHPVPTLGLFISQNADFTKYQTERITVHILEMVR